MGVILFKFLLCSILVIIIFFCSILVKKPYNCILRQTPKKDEPPWALPPSSKYAKSGGAKQKKKVSIFINQLLALIIAICLFHGSELCLICVLLYNSWNCELIGLLSCLEMEQGKAEEEEPMTNCFLRFPNTSPLLNPSCLADQGYFLIILFIFHMIRNLGLLPSVSPWY